MMAFNAGALLTWLGHWVILGIFVVILAETAAGRLPAARRLAAADPASARGSTAPSPPASWSSR
jgi:hypothetical protein